MRLQAVVGLSCVACAAALALAQEPAPDRIPAAGGDITIVPIAHGSLYVAQGQSGGSSAFKARKRWPTARRRVSPA